ncbi:MAG: hypothetical protein KIY12_10235 [Thermoplasmata archaeon]|uniref:Uncharacterized protein n=1 Tax=Candidatus Sysuiplasma superficiale TaxID=2823368 RepID=A0A8J8CGC9_9ARCH|nr:hypothetical protein [Candidatus Sysuiplasma superficiale]MBX8645075.1 hypothetical protein [Candidatus Sysuiplasma superficiale]
MKNEENESFSLVRGSEYRIVSAAGSDSQFETQGKFLGYVPFGDESALAVRISEGKDKGTVRIVPCNTVFYVDIIRQEKEKREEKTEVKPAFYG